MSSIADASTQDLGRSNYTSRLIAHGPFHLPVVLRNESTYSGCNRQAF